MWDKDIATYLILAFCISVRFCWDKPIANTPYMRWCDMPSRQVKSRNGAELDGGILYATLAKWLAARKPIENLWQSSC